MGLVQHEIIIEKNDCSLFEDEQFLYMEGHNVYDAINEILRAAGDQAALSSYTHVRLNGNLRSLAELKTMTISSELRVELITKSQGGLI